MGSGRGGAMAGAVSRQEGGSEVAELWVFGYGSLMWQPGFDFEEAVPATLQGAHRALCVYSVVHRGPATYRPV